MQFSTVSPSPHRAFAWYDGHISACASCALPTHKRGRHTAKGIVNTDVHFSKDSDEWATPRSVFSELDREFQFELDVAATDENRKCDRYFDRTANGLDQDWATRNWCNPPYSAIKEWVAKARREQIKGNLTVMLIPARTDTAFFHNSIYLKDNVEVRFLRGRVTFQGAKGQAPFPSMVVIFRPLV